jgi:hypothetical protein
MIAFIAAKPTQDTTSSPAAKTGGEKRWESGRRAMEGQP